MRILGLDIGSRRIGIAVSDELGLTAQGVESHNCSDLVRDLEYIVSLATEYAAEEIVVGIPYNMNGTEGPQVERVREIVSRMHTLTDIPIREWDERLSTVAAERTLLEANMSRGKRRKVVDKLAAVIILQGYLDMKHFRIEM